MVEGKKCWLDEWNCSYGDRVIDRWVLPTLPCQGPEDKMNFVPHRDCVCVHEWMCAYFLKLERWSLFSKLCPQIQNCSCIVQLLKITALSHSHVLTNNPDYPTQCENVLNMTPYNVLFSPNLFFGRSLGRSLQGAHHGAGDEWRDKQRHGPSTNSTE